MGPAAEHRVNEGEAKPFYVSNGVESAACIVLINGLGDNWDSGYAQALFDYGAAAGMAVLSVQLRSMPEIQHHRISDDCRDILAVYAHAKLAEYRHLCLVGHSSGAQGIMVAAGEIARNEKLVLVLQGAVSDREYEEHANPGLPGQLKAAKTSHGPIPFGHTYPKIHCRRFVELFATGGPEDFFSVGQPTARLNPVGHRVCCVVSREDEYRVVPLEKHVAQLQSIPGVTEVVVVPGGHSLQGSEPELFKILERLISEQGFKVTKRG